MQKFRADEFEIQTDGAIVWSSVWIGGRTLARINNCRVENMYGDIRRTVYVTGEPNNWFSVPAVTRIMGCRVTGYITGDDNGNLVFRHTYY